MSIYVELVGSHQALREGLRRILCRHPSFRVVAEAASGADAVAEARRCQPDVAVVDAEAGEWNGLEVAKQILQESPGTAVVLLSPYNDKRYWIRAIKAGARAYLLKDSLEVELVPSIELICAGKPVFSRGVGESLRGGLVSRLKFGKGEGPEDRLTPLEEEICGLLAEGKGNKEMAARLQLSLAAVEAHRARVMDKLDTNSMAELALAVAHRATVPEGPSET